jgi:hypothetical protein
VKVSSIVLVCSGFLALSAQAGAPVAEGEAVQTLDAESRALLQREISNRMAKVKSEADLQSYITSTRGSRTPLDLLSPGAKQRFIDSLVFTPNGLGSFTYADIRNELTLSEAYQLLSLFGREATAASIRGIRIESEEDRMISQMSVGIRNADYMDYWCRTTSTCTRKLEDICVAPGC